MNSEDMFLNGKLRDILIDINNKKDLVRLDQIFVLYCLKIIKYIGIKIIFIQSNLHYF